MKNKSLSPMWTCRTVALLALLAPMIPATASWAQTEAATKSAAASRFKGPLRLVAFQIVAGRVVATSVFDGGEVGQSAQTKSSGAQERLSVDINGDFPSVLYSRMSDSEEVQLEASEGDRLKMHRVVKGNSSQLPFSLEQIPGKKLKLTIGAGADARTVETDTLWQLFILEPQVARQELIPLLQIVRPDWRLLEQAQAVESAILDWGRSDNGLARRRWASLVAKLASENFQQRAAALRQLQRSGPELLCYLESLDRSQLDAEQRFQIRELISALSEAREDTPRQVALRLAGQKRIWLAMLGREAEADRQIAARQLGELLGETIDFDPAADADARARQIEQLRERIDPPAAGSRVSPQP